VRRLLLAAVCGLVLQLPRLLQLPRHCVCHRGPGVWRGPAPIALARWTDRGALLQDIGPFETQSFGG
jgi:hypothetical protein